MSTYNQDYIENYYSDKYTKRNTTESREIKKINNYDSERVSETYDIQQSNVQYYTDHSYDANKKKESTSYYIRHKKLTQDDNLNLIKQKIIYKNNNDNNIKKLEYKANNNDIMRINTITYFSETSNKTKGRSVSNIKKNKELENNIENGQGSLKFENKNPKIIKRIELDYGKKNNGNSKVSNYNNKNTSLKIINKNKTNYASYSNVINKDKEVKETNKEKTVGYRRRKNKNEIYISGNDKNINSDSNKLSEMEKDNKYGKYSSKITSNSNNYFIRMSNFEITYESDKGERKTYERTKNKNIINNYSNNNSYKNNNKYYSNINLEESNKYNNNNYEEINDNTYNSSSTTKSFPYKYQYQLVSNSITNNPTEKRITIIDPFDHNEIYNTFNNKSITFDSIGTRRSKDIAKNNNNCGKLKSIKTNSTKNLEDKIVNSIRNNNSIDININSPNSHKYNLIRNGYSVNTNKKTDNSVPLNNKAFLLEKNSYNSTNNTNNSSRIKKKTGNHIIKRVKGKTYYRKSDIRKIILIQSIYRTHLLNLKLSPNLDFIAIIKEILERLKYIFYF